MHCKMNEDSKDDNAENESQSSKTSEQPSIRCRLFEIEEDIEQACREKKEYGQTGQ